ncbi:MAG: hypothetical protein RL088_2329 [Verrucomicrobiota bacterium]|jgi:hypothetical protein
MKNTTVPSLLIAIPVPRSANLRPGSARSTEGILSLDSCQGRGRRGESSPDYIRKHI